MNFRHLIKSFAYAWRGISYVYTHEQNFRIQLLCALLVVLLMVFVPLRLLEVVIVVLLIMAVLVLEMLNSAMEKFIDVIQPRLSFHAQVVKDILAAAVLVTSLTAVIIGVLIFTPHLFELFRN